MLVRVEVDHPTVPSAAVVISAGAVTVVPISGRAFTVVHDDLVRAAFSLLDAYRAGEVPDGGRPYQVVRTPADGQ